MQIFTTRYSTLDSYKPPNLRIGRTFVDLVANVPVWLLWNSVSLYCSGWMSGVKETRNVHAKNIRYSNLDSYKLPKSQDRSWFWSQKTVLHKILHLYSAAGLYQSMSDAKVTPVCVHGFRWYHSLCFYIFLCLWKKFRDIQRCIKSWCVIGFCSFLFYLILK